MTIAPNVTVTDTDSGCGNNEDYPPTQIPTATHRRARQPGEPYGTYTVCVDNGTNHEHRDASPTRTTPAGNTVNIYLAYGATGHASGTCP